MITRRFLMAGGVAAAATLAGCAPPSKFRSYRGPRVTGIVVRKAERRMYLMNGVTAIRALDVELGPNPLGHKLHEGDGRTPEGAYMIDKRNPNSAYHLSVGISYPNALDLARAEALGLRPGGDIFIHGTPREKRGQQDWTAGCLAVTDREVEDVYAMVADGTPITIYA